MGRKKFNLCTKCDFRHVAPTGKNCSIGLNEQLDEREGKEKRQREQVLGREGLNDHESSPNSQKAVAIGSRVDKIEQDVAAMDGKLDLLIAGMKKTTLPESEEEDVVDDWSKNIAEAWKDVETRGRTKVKTKKPRHKPRYTSSSSSASSSSSLQREGDTKKFARRRFYPKDHKFKRCEEIVHVCVKVVEKVFNEGGDIAPAMKHLKFISDKVSKGCFNFAAIAGYDQAVRDRVELDGYAQFAIIETEDVFGHFSVENTLKSGEKTGAKTAKYKASSTKSNGICFRFNSEEGCSGKCYFIHKCSECESKAHGKKDCGKKSTK